MSNSRDILLVKQITISDKEGIACVGLSKILEAIPQKEDYYWSIISSDVTPVPESAKDIIEIEKKIDQSKIGIQVSLEELISFAKKIYQEIDLSIVGYEDKSALIQYENYEDIYEICDLIIEMIDCGFWIVRAKDIRIIDCLAEKFDEIEVVDS